jgi:hypothetical protein
MEKTKHDLLFEIQYAQRLCSLHQRLYRRTRALFLFATLLGTAGAVQSAFGSNPAFAVWGGIVLCVFGVLDQVLDPAKKSAAYEQDYKRYARLMRVARAMEPAAIQQEIDLLRESDEPEIEALRDVAYNNTVAECGMDASHAIKLGLVSRTMKALA